MRCAIFLLYPIAEEGIAKGRKTAINWRASKSVTLFKAHDFLAKARVSGGAEG